MSKKILGAKERRTQVDLGCPTAGKPKHTPGPWIYCKGNSDRARIVACMNACEGIADPNVVPELLRIVQYLADLSPDDLKTKGLRSANYYAAKAIARAEGRKP